MHPNATRTQDLIALIERGFSASGGDLNAGRRLPALLREMGREPVVAAHVIALEPRRSYLRLPPQFATALRGRLESLIGPASMAALLADVEMLNRASKRLEHDLHTYPGRRAHPRLKLARAGAPDSAKRRLLL